MKKRVLSSGSALASSVERDADNVPTAFRIWRAGSNMTDMGDSIFDSRSAELLMQEQEERGNRYSFDINHCSLDKTAPLENQRAVGTFALEVRNGELWAVDCRFTSSTRRELADGAWPSISPAYDIDKTTGQIVSFLNCALTGSPATHNATKLAATRIAAKRTTTKASPPMLMTRKSFSDSDLRMMASAGDAMVRDLARVELTRRGSTLCDPDSENGRALSRMRASSGLGPTKRIHFEGRTQVFESLTATEARDAMRADAGRRR